MELEYYITYLLKTAPFFIGILLGLIFIFYDQKQRGNK